MCVLIIDFYNNETIINLNREDNIQMKFLKNFIYSLFVSIIANLAANVLITLATKIFRIR